MSPSPSPRRARPLKVGLLLPHSTGSLAGASPRWADVLAFARHAEDAGFDSLWAVDHVLVRWADVLRQDHRPVPAEVEARGPSGYWECGSLLAALAATTSRVDLGTLVSCTGYRNPVLLANIAATVDEIGDGRFILGLGAGDFAGEHRALGVPFDRRVGRFEEAVAIVRGLLRAGSADLRGEHYDVREASLPLRGAGRATPPLLIGALGTGPRMLRLTAQYADLWNGWIAYGRSAPDAIAPLRAAVDAACERAGRDPATLGRTATVGVAFFGEPLVALGRVADPLVGSAEELASAFRGFAAQGIGHLQVELRPKTRAGIDALAAVLELLDRG